MARGRRRSSRLGGPTVTTPEPAQAAPSSAQDPADSRQDDEKCPACEGADHQVDKVDQENWVRCDACRTWFHWRCVGEGDLEAIDKWCAPSPPALFFHTSLRRTFATSQVLQVVHGRGQHKGNYSPATRTKIVEEADTEGLCGST